MSKKEKCRFCNGTGYEIECLDYGIFYEVPCHNCQYGKRDSKPSKKRA